MPDAPADPAFAVFTEVGILHQIATAFLEARLPEGLIAPHFAVLNHLIRLGGGQTPLDLARALQVPKTSMTHTLTILSKRSLIEMRPNPKDGRSKLVFVTEAGRAVRDDTVVALAPVFARLSADVPNDTMSTLLPHLRELRVAIDALRDEIE